MQAVKNRGLSGKHRLSHHRSRAARLHAKSLIEEFFEPEALDSVRSQPIPIRSRREFLPTIAESTGAPLDLETRPLRGEPCDPSIERADGDLVAVADDPSGAGPATLCDASMMATDVVVPVEQIFLNQRAAADRAERFTVGGFVLGCAIGGAVGMTLLVILRIALG